MTILYLQVFAVENILPQYYSSFFGYKKALVEWIDSLNSLEFGTTESVVLEAVLMRKCKLEIFFPVEEQWSC